MIVWCQWCGGKFERPARRGPVPKFCSPAHRQAAFRDRHDLSYTTAETTAAIEDAISYYLMASSENFGSGWQDTDESGETQRRREVLQRFLARTSTDR